MRVKDTRTTIIAIEGSKVVSDFGAALSQMQRAFPPLWALLRHAKIPFLFLPMREGFDVPVEWQKV